LIFATSEISICKFIELIEAAQRGERKRVKLIHQQAELKANN